MKKLFILLAVLLLATGFAFAQEAENDQPQTAQTQTTQAQPAQTQAQPAQTQAQPAQTQAQNEVEAEDEKKRPIELFNLEVSMGFPVHWTNGLHLDWFPQNDIQWEDKTVTANTAIGLALVFNFTRTFGLSLDLDLFFGGRLAGFSSPTSDYNSLFGANVFLGPLFYLYNNDILRIPLQVGVHMYYFSDDIWLPDLSAGNAGAWMYRSDMQVGLSLSLGIQFHFDKNIYMFSKTNVSVDALRIHTIRWVTSSSGSPEFEEKSHTDILLDINWGVKPSFGLGIKF
ncbi:MAG: hypothetical protein FWB86_05185 [Treponema sp.]|nr:hypothetical protein [Treponema sp.]MCL2251059.1 hypothetical protein [Treponema sp.]